MQGVSNYKSDRIDIKTTKRNKMFLKRAAETSHKTITEFLLEHGLRAAEQVLADKRIFILNDEQWTLFNEALDRPVQSKPNLKKLLSEPSVFEK